MNLKFILNEYILIWNLLFKESFSKEINDKKQKIWYNFEKEYNSLAKEKKNLLDDPKNYIPTDDTIYNIVKEEDFYIDIYNNTDKYKLNLRKTWNSYKNDITTELNNLLKIKLFNAEIYVVDPRINIIDYSNDNNKIIYGTNNGNDIETILNLIYYIVYKNTKDSYNDLDKDVVKAVLELVILNEVATRITGISYYLSGDSRLNKLKKEIYPYFLMYMGVKEEDYINYMKRDSIMFNAKDYVYNSELKGINIDEFIIFCIKNKGENNNIEIL